MPRIASAKRKSPKRLAAKLLEIRRGFRESQNGILRRLNLEQEFERDYVSKWERGLLEPTLLVLCAYAEAANVYVEAIIKDDLDLPEKLPSTVKSEGIRWISTTEIHKSE